MLMSAPLRPAGMLPARAFVYSLFDTLTIDSAIFVFEFGILFFDFMKLLFLLVLFVWSGLPINMLSILIEMDFFEQRFCC